MAYFDEDGNEVADLMTKDEAAELVKESTKEAMEGAATAKTALETATAATAALQTQVDEAAAAQAAAGGEGAAGEGDKDKNLAALRTKLEESQAATTAANEAANVRIASLEGDKVAQAIAAVSGGNAELAEKIKHNFEKTLSGVVANTPEEVAAKVANAVKLSGGPTAPNPLDNVIPAGAPAGGGPKPVAQATEFNENEKSIGGKLGISDADREKYGNDPRLSKNTN